MHSINELKVSLRGLNTVEMIAQMAKAGEVETRVDAGCVVKDGDIWSCRSAETSFIRIGLVEVFRRPGRKARGPLYVNVVFSLVRHRIILPFRHLCLAYRTAGLNKS